MKREVGRRQKADGSKNGHATERQVAVTLRGPVALNFEQFKESFGVTADAEAARQLITQRLAQLRRTGRLARAA